MKLSEGVEWGIHCGVLLGFLASDQSLPTARLAEYHGVPAAYLAKHLQAMSRTGLLESVQGPRGGYRLARPPTEISMLEIVEAIDGPEPAFRCAEIRRRGPTARPAREYPLPCAIHAVMNDADEAWRQELRSVSLADLMMNVMGAASPRSLELGARWMQEVGAMKVFLTGGTGVIGRPTVTRLLDAGHTVRAVARRDEAAAQLRDAGAEPVAVDLFDAAAVRDAVVGSEAVLHLATNVPAYPKMLPKAWTTHNRLRTEATRHLVDTAREAGVARMVKESVTFMYADGGDQWLDERAPLIPKLGMIAPTVEGEQIALELASADAESVVLRFGLFYGGPGNRGTEEMLKLAQKGRSLVAGKPGAYMSAIHADDAAAAVVAALQVPSGIYNATDDEPLTRRAALDTFAATFGTKHLRLNPGWMLRPVAGPAADALTASQRVSNAKLRSSSGWSPTYPSLREGFAADAARRTEPGVGDA